MSILTLLITSLNLQKYWGYVVAFGVGSLGLLVLIASIYRVASNRQLAKVQLETLKQYKVEADVKADISKLDAAAARSELRRKWSRK